MTVTNVYPTIEPVVPEAVMRKVTRRIIPFVFVCYVISYIDRVNVGFAALTMNRDLGLTPAQFGIGAGLFFIGYFLFEIPSNLIMSDAYDAAFRASAREAAARLGIDLKEGVYAAWLGPQFETPAEIRFMRAAGGDLAGMSTVQEVIAARHMGIRVLGISVVTNPAAGVSSEKIDHEAVLEVGARAAGSLTALVRELVPTLSA